MYTLSVIILKNGARRNNLPQISTRNNRNFAAPKQDNNLDEFSLNKSFSRGHATVHLAELVVVVVNQHSRIILDLVEFRR